MKKRCSILTALALSLAMAGSQPAMAMGQTSVPASYEASVSSQTESQTETKVSVSGLATSISRKASPKAIRDKIQITPAHKCTVKLQLYNSTKKKWTTRKSYKLSASSNGKLTLKYSSDWKYAKKTKWRVYIPGGNGYHKYVSDDITIKSYRPNRSGLSLSCRSAVIMRASDGYVIYSKNKNKRLAQASTTKMMTALLTIEDGNLMGTAVMSKKAANTAWGCLGASSGTKYRVLDLLNVMLVHSSNDAASCLAEYNAGSIKAFAAKMNERAAQLGCKNTNFVNPHGLDASRHYSSAYDLCLIQRACIKHGLYRKIIKKKSYTIRSLNKGKKARTYYTTDDLLYDKIGGFMGGKTGTTGNAGCCFSGAFKYKGVTYVFAELGSSSDSARWKNSRKLINFVKKNYK